MKRTLFLLAVLLQTVFFGYAQTIPVSTGLNAALTANEPIGNADPYWKIASSPNPPGTPARVSTYYTGYWQPTPVVPTYAGWINVPGNAYGYNIPGIYVFERDFNVPAGASSFTCNFGVAYDDALVSVELVSPSAVTTPLTVVPTTAYYLSQPITTTIASPASGTWKIRVTVNFIDYIGAFLLSGYIDINPCRNTFIQGLDNMGGTAPGIFDDPAGGFFATGLLKDSTVIVKEDASGNILWIRKFLLGTGYYQIRDLKVDASGDLLAIAHKQGANYQSAIFRCNATATAFSWIKAKTNIAYSQLHILGAADFIVTASNNGGFTQLERRSKATGNVSAYSLQGEGGDYYSALDNGNLYGACRRYYTAGGDFRVAVFSHNANTGAFQWQNSIISRGDASGPTQTRMYPVAPAVDNPSQALAILSSGDLVGFNSYTLGPVELVAAQTTQTGNVNWTMEYVIANYNRPNAVTIKNTSTGYYMVACLYLPTLGNFGYTVVIKTDKSGNVQWARQLGISGKNIATSAVERNGSLYLSMVSDSYSPNQLILVKLDAQGNSNGACTFIKSIQATAKPMQNIQDARMYNTATNTLAETNIGTTPAPVTPLPRLYCETPCDKKRVIIKGNWFITPGTKVRLTAEGMDGDYEWSTGSREQSIDVDAPGDYCVTVTQGDDIAGDCHTVVYFDEDMRKTTTVKSKAAPTQPAITLSPNPAGNTVTLVMGNIPLTKAGINIVDQYGKIVYQGVFPAGQQKLSLQVGHLSPAIYTVTVYTDDKKLATAKLVKL